MYNIIFVNLRDKLQRSDVVNHYQFRIFLLVTAALYDMSELNRSQYDCLAFAESGQSDASHMGGIRRSRISGEIAVRLESRYRPLQ
jgi:hypothetical protein